MNNPIVVISTWTKTDFEIQCKECVDRGLLLERVFIQAFENGPPMYHAVFVDPAVKLLYRQGL